MDTNISLEKSRENIEKIIYKDGDSLVRMMVLSGQARVFMARTTRLSQVASDTHLASDVASAAASRVLTACAFLSNMIKEDEGSVSLIFAGNGEGGKIIAVGEKGKLKVSLENPQLELPKLEDGRLDVEGFIGSSGRLTIIKDMGKNLSSYIGHADIISGGVAMDLANYFTVSEQTPSLVSIGCLNQNGVVLSAGGIFIQALPNASEEAIQKLEMMIPFFANISRELFDRSIEDLARLWFRDMDLEILEETPLSYSCSCSREKMENALLASGKEALNEMIRENKPVEMDCHFCRRHEKFELEELKELLARS